MMTYIVDLLNLAKINKFVIKLYHWKYVFSSEKNMQNNYEHSHNCNYDSYAVFYISDN